MELFGDAYEFGFQPQTSANTMLMSLTAADGVRLAEGIRLVPGLDLLAQYALPFNHLYLVGPASAGAPDPTPAQVAGGAYRLVVLEDEDLPVG